MIWTNGEIVTDTLLNTELRDNLNEVAQHDHSGGSGSGTGALGGTAGLTVINFADAAAPAAPTGTLTRLFTTGSTVGVISSGGTARILADTSHEHVTALSENIRSETGAGDASEALSVPFLGTAAFLNTATISTSLAVNGSGRRAVLVSVAWVGKANSTASATGTVTLTRAGTALGSRLFTAHSGSAGQIMFIYSTFETTVASGTYAYSATFSSTAIWFVRMALDVNEISVP